MRACIKKHEAFTLVELLVVIAIISILAGLLLPALENTIYSARVVACQSNQRQAYLAMADYGSEFDGWVAVEDKGRAYDFSSNNYSYSCNVIFYYGGALINHGVWLLGERCQPSVLFCPDITFDQPSAGMETKYTYAEALAPYEGEWHEWLVTGHESGTPGGGVIINMTTYAFNTQITPLTNPSQLPPGPYNYGWTSSPVSSFAKGMRMHDFDSKYPVLCDGRTRSSRQSSSHSGRGFGVLFGDGSVTFFNTPAIIADGIARTSGSAKTSYLAHADQTELPENPLNDGEVSPYAVTCPNKTYYIGGELWNRFYYLRNE